MPLVFGRRVRQLVPSLSVTKHMYVYVLLSPSRLLPARQTAMGTLYKNHIDFLLGQPWQTQALHCARTNNNNTCIVPRTKGAPPQHYIQVRCVARQQVSASLRFDTFSHRVSTIHILYICFLWRRILHPLRHRPHKPAISGHCGNNSIAMLVTHHV